MFKPVAAPVAVEAAVELFEEYRAMIELAKNATQTIVEMCVILIRK
jgi:hypothetical protein